MSKKRLPVFKVRPDERWAGIWYGLIVLIVLVVLLTAAIVALNRSGMATANVPTPVFTPTPTMPGDVVVTPPSVDPSGMVVAGALIVLIVLAALLREVDWFRKRS